MEVVRATCPQRSAKEEKREEKVGWDPLPSPLVGVLLRDSAEVALLLHVPSFCPLVVLALLLSRSQSRTGK